MDRPIPTPDTVHAGPGSPTRWSPRAGRSQETPQRSPDAPAELNLDRSAQPTGPNPPRFRNLRTVTAAVLAATAGLVTGAAGMHAWDADQSRNKQASTVSLLAMVDAAEGYSGGGGAPGQAALDGFLAVINAGPRPLTVTEITGSGDKVTLTGMTPKGEVRPGSQIAVPVMLAARCPSQGFLPTDPLMLAVTVRTENGRTLHAAVPLALHATSWDDAVHQMCSPQG